MELLEELEPMADIGPVGLGEVLLVLGPRLNSLSAAPKDARYGKVWVGGIEEARGMAFRAVYRAGRERRAVSAAAGGRSAAAGGAARGAGDRAAGGGHGAAADRGGVRDGAIRAFVFAAGSADGAGAGALVLRVRGAPGGGRERDRRAGVRGARAVGDGDADRMAGAGERRRTRSTTRSSIWRRWRR